ncbi:MAG: hypothetical protein M1335_02735 [Chloroflexi bacterium]|nr:hypothetical protein [Chloroflexota bacterium]
MEMNVGARRPTIKMMAPLLIFVIGYQLGAYSTTEKPAIVTQAASEAGAKPPKSPGEAGKTIPTTQAPARATPTAPPAPSGQTSNPTTDQSGLNTNIYIEARNQVGFIVLEPTWLPNGVLPALPSKTTTANPRYYDNGAGFMVKYLGMGNGLDLIEGPIVDHSDFDENIGPIETPGGVLVNVQKIGNELCAWWEAEGSRYRVDAMGTSQDDLLTFIDRLGAVN